MKEEKSQVIQSLAPPFSKDFQSSLTEGIFLFLSSISPEIKQEELN